MFINKLKIRLKYNYEQTNNDPKYFQITTLNRKDYILTSSCRITCTKKKTYGSICIPKCKSHSVAKPLPPGYITFQRHSHIVPIKKAGSAVETATSSDESIDTGASYFARLASLPPGDSLRRANPHSVDLQQ